MNKDFLLANIVLLILFLSPAASAETVHDVQLSSHYATQLSERIEQLEARLAAFEASEVSLNGSVQKDGCKSGKCDSFCDCGGCWCTPCSGLVASAELLLFQMYNSDGPDNPTGGEWQDAFHTGSRTTVGYMNGCGRTIRARYFEFATVDDSIFREDLQVESLDIEYAGRFTIGCGWYGELSGGVRWASWNEANDFKYDDTIGPVVGIEIRTDVLFGLSLYGNARQSYQFGYGFDNQAGTRGRGTYGISELELGIEWQRCMLGRAFFARGGFASQYYTGVLDSSDEDLGLVGFVIAAGLTH